MSRFHTPVLAPKSNRALRLPESAFYIFTGATLVAWALSLVADLAPKFSTALNLQTPLQSVVLRNSGSSALIVALAVLSAISFYGLISALRDRSLPTPSASLLLVTICALRTLQIFTEGTVSIVDANILGALFFAATLLYYGTARLWWLLLMPLATIASFSPLVWLEFYKGASTHVLISALWVPGAAFVAGSFLIVMRELRFRSIANINSISLLRARGESTLSSLRAMEIDLKSLASILSSRTLLSQASASRAPSSQQLSTEQAASSSHAAPVEVLAGIHVEIETTEFNLKPASVKASESSSFDEIDASARRLLAEARAVVEGRPVNLSLAAPKGAGLPIAVRGSAADIANWMKSAILNSIDSLGGFPDGMVRVSIRPGLSSLVISVEDNGRGFGESRLVKMGALGGQNENRLSILDVRSGVEDLGGRFDIQARLGVGSRLSI